MNCYGQGNKRNKTAAKAEKSSNESKAWLTLLRDADKEDKDELNWLLKELLELSNIFASSIITLKGKK
ncbi:MAG: four helix bundle protein [Candidatus Paceibacter sp.]|nr:four helix bundle protein [Candidatus Paceibacter sp.]